MRPSLWIVLAVCLPLAGGCSGMAGRTPAAATTDAVSKEGADRVARHLEVLERLASASAAEQEVMIEAARIDFVAVPTGSNRLRYALVLGTPGHAGFDPVRAGQLMQLLLSEPDGLSESEHNLAGVVNRELENLLSLQARLEEQESGEAAVLQGLAMAQQQNHSLAAENARLREELKIATRKLEAIAELEKTLSTRRIAPEDRP